MAACREERALWHDEPRAWQYEMRSVVGGAGGPGLCRVVRAGASHAVPVGV